MKLRKLKLNEASKAELNEREMCRVLGGGTIGCCQCGQMLKVNPVALVLVLMIVPIMLMGIHGIGSHPGVCSSTTDPKPEFPKFPDFPVMPQDALCGATQGHSCGI